MQKFKFKIEEKVQVLTELDLRYWVYNALNQGKTWRL